MWALGSLYTSVSTSQVIRAIFASSTIDRKHRVVAMRFSEIYRPLAQWSFFVESLIRPFIRNWPGCIPTNNIGHLSFDHNIVVLHGSNRSRETTWTIISLYNMLIGHSKRTSSQLGFQPLSKSCGFLLDEYISRNLLVTLPSTHHAILHQVEYTFDTTLMPSLRMSVTILFWKTAYGLSCCKLCFMTLTIRKTSTTLSTTNCSLEFLLS